MKGLHYKSDAFVNIWACVKLQKHYRLQIIQQQQKHIHKQYSVAKIAERERKKFCIKVGKFSSGN